MIKIFSKVFAVVRKADTWCVSVLDGVCSYRAGPLVLMGHPVQVQVGLGGVTSNDGRVHGGAAAALHPSDPPPLAILLSMYALWVGPKSKFFKHDLP